MKLPKSSLFVVVGLVLPVPAFAHHAMDSPRRHSSRGCCPDSPILSLVWTISCFF